MQIIGIDPGSEMSAYCVIKAQGKNIEIVDKGKISNNEMLVFCTETSPWVKFHHQDHKIGIEMIASYGMAVGKDVFETCVWIGRFIERLGTEPERIYRREEKMTLCGSMKAKDSNIMQALIDMFPKTGGGKIPQKGTKAKPGPLYGMANDMWAALAVCVTLMEKERQKRFNGKELGK